MPNSSLLPTTIVLQALNSKVEESDWEDFFINKGLSDFKTTCLADEDWLPIYRLLCNGIF